MAHIRNCMTRVVLASAVAVLSWASHAAEPPQPYVVEVWSDTLFGMDGTAQRVEIVRPEQYPAGFVERVKQRFAAMRIPPVKDDKGEPATFQTGVRLSVEITPPGADGKGGSARIGGVQMGPLVLKAYAASRPDDVPADSQTLAEVECVVGVDGACGDVKLARVLPDSPTFRRWAVASLRGYKFAPQRVNGTPVPAPYKVTLVLEVLPDAAPPDFRQSSNRLPGRDGVKGP